MNKKVSHNFAVEWIEAWNSHDLDRIMNHYVNNFELSSPVIKKMTDESSGILRGKKEIRAYWEKALNINPELNFELVNSFLGVNSVIIHYKGHRGLSAEIFFFDDEGKVTNSHAHYEK